MPRRPSETPFGFTLIELVVVVTLLALIASIACVKLSSGYRRAQRRRASEQIAEIDRHARQLALRRGCPCELRVDVSENRLRLFEPHAKSDGYERRWRLASPIEIAAARTGRESRRSGDVAIRYNRDGQSDTYAVAITSPSAGDAWLLVAGGSGQVVEGLDERRIEEVLRGLAKDRVDAD